MGLSHQAIYPRLKKVLSEAADYPANEIKADMKLEESPLFFAPNGKRALAGKLNDEFDEEGLVLTREQTESAERVRDLHDLIYEQIGEG